MLVDGGNSGSGGYLRYLRGIFGLPLPPDIEVVLLCSPAIAAALAPLDPAVRVIMEPQLSAVRRRDRLGWWRRSYPKLVQELQPDLVLHPSGLVRGDSGGRPTVAVHHLMAPFTPATYRLYGLSRDSLRFLFWRLRLGRSFRRAEGVIFLTDYTRNAVTRQVRGIRRTAVVPNALPAEFLELPPRSYDELTPPIRILCVSTLFLFKHQWHVVDAVADLRERTGLDLRVDFVGGGEPRARNKLRQRIRERDAAAWATMIEQVPPDDMSARYAAADLFVFPSADEAWPITLGEAMAHGLPIACSARMAMPSILRDAGVYFDPEKPEEIVTALRWLLEDPALRLECGKRAKEYAGEFTWSRSAEQVFAFLRDVHRAHVRDSAHSSDTDRRERTSL